MLTFKRAYESRSVGPWSYEDYNVFDGDQCVGHVLYQFQGPEGRPWLWFIDAGEPQNMHECGYAATREQALTAFKAKLDSRRMPQVIAA